MADLDVLGIVVRNLLENAVLYGAPDAPIAVSIEKNYCVRVSNGGPVIPADVLAVLKKPFQRGTSAGQGGGLGLAIVDNIMTQLGGHIRLQSPAEGQAAGFEAVLVFPAPKIRIPPAFEAMQRPSPFRSSHVRRPADIPSRRQ